MALKDGTANSFSNSVVRIDSVKYTPPVSTHNVNFHILLIMAETYLDREAPLWTSGHLEDLKMIVCNSENAGFVPAENRTEQSQVGGFHGAQALAHETAVLYRLPPSTR